jgi:predicted nucleotidyltransferase
MTIENILEKLYAAFKQAPYVHAVWLEGSRVEGLADEYSDYDVWVDVDDEAEQTVIDLAETTLKTFSNLDVKFELPKSHPHLRHVTYHVEGTGKFEVIEVNTQKHSRNYQFVKGVDKIQVIFDKDETIKYCEPKVDSGIVWVERELMRKNYLEAYAAYEFWLLKPLVELARIKYAPSKQEYDLKHIARDLPQELVGAFTELYQNQSSGDIEKHITTARHLRDAL